MSHISELKKLIAEKDATITELNQKLDESYRDLELLSLDWDKANEIIVKKVTVTLAKRVQIWFITKMAYLVCNCLDFFYN